MLRASAREAHRRGGWGHAWEDKLLTHPWGLALGTIATEVHVWQPGHDYLVPPAMGRYLAAAIPTSQLTVLAEAGTLLFLDRWAEILVALVA
jgi:pimeloyl-ACP methyl ester carboxylesterase